MEKVRAPLLGIVFGLLMIFTSSYLLLFTWKSMIGHYSLIVLASFFGGVLIVDFERSLKLVAGAYITSCIVVVLLYMLPAILYGEAYQGEIDVIVAITATDIARTVLISFPVSVFMSLLGCFSAKSFLENE